MRHLPVLGLFLAAAATATAQGWTPLNQATPPGFAGAAFASGNPSLRGAIQPVELLLPAGTTATVFRGSATNVVPFPAGEIVGLEVGSVHRLSVTGVPEMAGVQLYPTVELIDRLHPPAGRATEFPVPIELTAEELQAAATDGMVTKVIYLQARNSVAFPVEGFQLATLVLPPDANPVQEAAAYGRPVAILRLGGRTPGPGETAGPFFGSGRVVSPVLPDHVVAADARVSLPLHCGDELPVTNADLYPDEYVCDGGDTGLPNRPPKDASDVNELDYEETVGTFVGDEGRVHLRPSTRVCLYSPAFAATRVINGTGLGVQVVKLAGAHDGTVASDLAVRQGIGLGHKVDGRDQLRVRSRASGLIRERSDSVADQVVKLDEQTNVLGVFQDEGLLNPILLDGDARAVMGLAVAAGAEWSENRPPVIAGKIDGYGVAISKAAPEEYVLYEDRRGPGDLVLVKTADRASAKSGEEVSFSIRFDNQGGKPIREVIISDHLSPRLAYVEGSAAVSVPAEVKTIPDGVGSVILRVELNQPLEGGEGGAVTFRCRVR